MYGNYNPTPIAVHPQYVNALKHACEQPGGSDVKIQISKDALHAYKRGSGGDSSSSGTLAVTLPLTSMQVKKLNAATGHRGVSLHLSKTAVRHAMTNKEKYGGFAEFAIPLGMALATGVASAGASYGTKKLLGKLFGASVLGDGVGASIASPEPGGSSQNIVTLPPPIMVGGRMSCDPLTLDRWRGPECQLPPRILRPQSRDRIQYQKNPSEARLRSTYSLMSIAHTMRSLHNNCLNILGSGCRCTRVVSVKFYLLNHLVERHSYQNRMSQDSWYVHMRPSVFLNQHYLAN